MKHLDLFSGIGGFALAAEWVWPEVEHVFCDNEPFAQAVLSKHWPNAPIHGDIRQVTPDTIGCGHLHRQPEKLAAEGGEQAFREPTASCVGFNVDLLTGGFPCQPFSQAGRRRGTEDSRHLWPEMLRVIRKFHPRWVVGENVGGLATWNDGMVLEQIHADLEGEGYEVQAFIIPAVSVNAPHRRDRIWIAAHATSKREGGESRKVRGAERGQNDERLSRTKQSNLGVASHSQDANRGARPQRRKGAEIGTQRNNEPGRCDSIAADPAFFNEERRKRKGNGAGRPEGTDRNTNWNANWLEVATRLCRVDDGLPRRLDRNPRLKGLGNAIVPQVAAQIFQAIKDIDK